MTPDVWHILCLHNSSSVPYFRQPPNLPIAACRNQKCIECGTTAFGRNQMSAETAHLATFVSESEAKSLSTSTIIFTTRCYAESGIATNDWCKLSVCPSVHPSVTLRYSDQICWNTLKISQLISLDLGSSVSADGNITDYSKGRPNISNFSWNRSGVGKSGCSEHKIYITCISEIWQDKRKLLLAAYINSCTRY